MKIGHHLLCQTCRAPVPVAYDTAVTVVLCTDCQPKDSPLKTALKCVLEAIRPRLTVAALVIVLYVTAVGSMAAVMVWR